MKQTDDQMIEIVNRNHRDRAEVKAKQDVSAPIIWKCIRTILTPVLPSPLRWASPVPLHRS